jgi:hypothetical protein
MAQVVSGTPSFTGESMPVKKSKVVSGLTATARSFALLSFCHVADVATVPLSDRGGDLRRVLTIQIQDSLRRSVLGRKLRRGVSNSLGRRGTGDDGYSILS